MAGSAIANQNRCYSTTCVRCTQLTQKENYGEKGPNPDSVARKFFRVVEGRRKEYIY